MHGFILEDPEHRSLSMGSLTSLDHSLPHWLSFLSISISFFKKNECISLDWRDWKNALQLSPLENFPGHPKMCLHVCFLWNPFTSQCKTPGSRLTVWKWVFCIETKKTNFCNKIEEAGDHLYEIKCGTQKRWGFCVLRGSWESWSECMTVTIRQRDWKIRGKGEQRRGNKYQAVKSSSTLQHSGGYCSLP